MRARQPVWRFPLFGALALLLVDLVVFHKEAHDVKTREAAIESIVWVSIGLAFTFVVWFAFSGAAAGEYISGYLIEKSLSVDNVFVWALLFTTMAIPLKFQHRVLFWCTISRTPNIRTSRAARSLPTCLASTSTS